MKNKTIFYIECKTALQDKLYYFVLYKIYYKLFLIGKSERSKHQIYDNYGLIDTLGWKSEKNYFTCSFSEEMGSCYTIFLPFKLQITLYDYSYPKMIYFEKR